MPNQVNTLEFRHHSYSRSYSTLDYFSYKFSFDD